MKRFSRFGLLALVGVAMAPVASAQEPKLVKDINSGSTSNPFFPDRPHDRLTTCRVVVG